MGARGLKCMFVGACACIIIICAGNVRAKGAGHANVFACAFVCANVRT